MLVADLLAALFFFTTLLQRRDAQGTAQTGQTGQVVDAYSGQPVAGVTVTVGGQQATTNQQGTFQIPASTAEATLVVQPSGTYGGAEQTIPAGQGAARETVTVALRPTVVSGTVSSSSGGAPLPGITVRAVNARGEQSSEATTGADGRYTIQGVPEAARLVVEGPNVARQEVEVGERTAVDVTLRTDTLAGTVRAKDGKPVANATVAAGQVTAKTGADGAYTLRGVPQDGQLVVKARGYRAQRRALDGTATLDFTLEPLVVKGIYLTPDSIIDETKFNALLALADRTEINAMVIDFKDETGWVYHDSQVPLAREIGAVHPSYDPRQRLKTLKEHGIYAIARVVCFQDHTLATKRPEFAVHNTATGGVWKNYNGVAWTSAMKPQTWDYLASIAAEAAQVGFDEVQYDYVRFPTDGDTELMDFGAPNTMEGRTDAIANFLKRTREVLAPYGVALGVDVFGIALFDKTDYDGIGQLLEKIAPQVDYICPMVYPSHYIPGALGLDVPNNHPYEVVIGSLQKAEARIPDPALTFRPWLQDFSYGRGIDYGPNEIRAQIKGTYDFGSTGWMLWNAANEYTEGGLLPEGR